MRNKTEIYKRIANDESIHNYIERSILNDILNSAYDFEKINPQATINEFLKFTDQLEKFDIETKRDTTDEQAVQVSTIHKSKGLEFKTVFIIDVATFKIPLRYSEKPFFVPRELAKGVLPASDPKEEFTREERRVLYVGMTRTKENLFLMYPTQYENRSKANKASKFLVALKPKENDNVNFIKHDSSSSETISSAFDAVEVLKGEQLNQAIKNLHSEQYESAIQKILNLAKINHFQKNNNTKEFSFDNLVNQSPSEEIQQRLEGTLPEKMGYSHNMSFSKFETYEKCPKKFWYANVLNALPENQEAAALYKGSTFHKIIEESAKRQKEGKIDDVKTLLEDLADRWDSTKYLTSPVQKEQEDKKSLKPALESYQKWTSTNPNEIVELEWRFSTKIGDYKVNGVIDRIEKTPEGEFVVIDYKTGGKNKKVDAQNSLQLNLYAHALKESEEFGKYPVKAAFFYVEKPEGEQVFEYEVSEEKVQEIKEILEGFATKIKEKEFDATPEMFTCKWCEYSDICEESKKL